MEAGALKANAMQTQFFGMIMSKNFSVFFLFKTHFDNLFNISKRLVHSFALSKATTKKGALNNIKPISVFLDQYWELPALNSSYTLFLHNFPYNTTDVQDVRSFLQFKPIWFLGPYAGV